ncbi:MAG: glycyl-radical enzyme activating protein [Bacteroidales bacterium]
MAFLFDIRRFSVHDGPGIRTTLFFKGCLLQCPWCHNPESRNSEPECFMRENRVGEKVFQVTETIGKDYSTSEIMKEILRDRPFYEESGGGVTFSGGEPLLQPGPLLELLRACELESLHTAVDTSGYADETVFHNVAEHTDLFLYDIKHSDPEIHYQMTGVKIDSIIANLHYLAQINKDIIIRIPLIPDWNTDEGNITGTLKLLLKIKPAVKRVDLLPYHKLGNTKSEKMKLTPSYYPELDKKRLSSWQNALHSHGFINIVGG